jgi:hypothetical protein
VDEPGIGIETVITTSSNAATLRYLAQLNGEPTEVVITRP